MVERSEVLPSRSRRNRSSEAAQQTVSNNLGMASDAGDLSVVALLDLNGKNILPQKNIMAIGMKMQH